MTHEHHMNHSMMNHSMHMDATTMGMHNHHNHGMTTMGGGHAGHDGHDMTSAGGHAGHNTEVGTGHMMKMYFFTEGWEETTVLFNGWITDEAWKLALTCIGIFILAALYEGLKVLREHLLRKHAVHVNRQTYALPSDSNSKEVMITETHQTVKTRMCSWGHFLQTCLHMVQVFVSYMLMLIFMTYNVYLCISVIAGAGLGYFLFGWKKSIVVDVNEHCH